MKKVAIDCLETSCVGHRNLPAFLAKGGKIAILTEYPAVRFVGGGAEDTTGIRFDIIRRKDGKVKTTLQLISPQDVSSATSDALSDCCADAGDEDGCDPSQCDEDPKLVKQADKDLRRLMAKRAKKVARLLEGKRWVALSPVTKKSSPLAFYYSEGDTAVELSVREGRKVRAQTKLSIVCPDQEGCSLDSASAWVDPGGKFAVFRVIAAEAGEHVVRFSVTKLN